MTFEKLFPYKLKDKLWNNKMYNNKTHDKVRYTIGTDLPMYWLYWLIVFTCLKCQHSVVLLIISQKNAQGFITLLT